MPPDLGVTVGAVVVVVVGLVVVVVGAVVVVAVVGLVVVVVAGVVVVDLQLKPTKTMERTRTRVNAK